MSYFNQKKTDNKIGHVFVTVINGEKLVLRSKFPSQTALKINDPCSACALVKVKESGSQKDCFKYVPFCMAHMREDGKCVVYKRVNRNDDKQTISKLNR